MNMLDDMLAAARAGEPVYITNVRERFRVLPETESFGMDIAVRRLDGETRVFPLRLPRRAPSAGEDVRNFVREFFLAEIYNLLSSLGARSITLHCPGGVDEGEALSRVFHDAFGLDLPASKRQGYGKCLNVLDRMLPALFPEASEEEKRFSIAVSGEAAPAASSAPAIATSGCGAVDVFRRSAENLAGKNLLGIDIGGTDIKLVLAMDGAIVCCKEFDWYPAGMTTVEEFVRPVLLLIALLAWKARAHRDRDAALAGLLDSALGRDAGVPAMERAIGAAAARRGDCGFLFDAIGMCFPDVVVGNKIVGGETLKTRGMRDHWGDGYDAEYVKLTHLDDALRWFVRPGGAVGIVNDGPMAAFAAGVEAAASHPDSVRNGVFAHTLGTELGSGWVTDAGAFPDIPLEVYNFVIDLGSYPQRQYDPDDVRSVNNFNTRLPGTLQKYPSQSGVFRLAFKHLPGARPDIVREIENRGFVVWRDGGLFIPTSPADMRKPFLEFLMELAEKEDDPALNRIFEEIGVSLAVTGREVDRLLAPAAKQRMLFGRLVKRAKCFDLMRKGALSHDPEAELTVADDSIAETPLMRELGGSRECTIAQFAQAVGAVHFANHLLG